MPADSTYEKTLRDVNRRVNKLDAKVKAKVAIKEAVAAEHREGGKILLEMMEILSKALLACSAIAESRDAAVQLNKEMYAQSEGLLKRNHELHTQITALKKTVKALQRTRLTPTKKRTAKKRAH